jgi:Tol biopolymer transport system component
MRRSGSWLLVVGFAVGCGDDGSSASDSDSESSSGTAATSTTGTSGSDDAPPVTSTSAADSTTLPGSTDTGGDGSSSSGGGVAIEEPLRIVFVADDDIEDVDELWFLDEANYEAGPMRLNQALIGPRFISPVTPISSDGRWLAYRTVRLAPGAEHELWLVDVATPVPEAGVRVDESAELIHDYDFSADAGYLAWITGTGVFSVDLAGAVPGALTSLTTPPAVGGEYVLFELSGSGDTVFYTADPGGDDVENLFAVPIDGSGSATVLSDLSVPATSVDGNSIFPDPAGGWVVYQADRDVAEPELFWVDLAPLSSPVKINDPLSTEAMRTERLSPTGQHVAYWAGVLGTPDLGDVFVAPLDGDGPGAPVAVHTAPTGQPQAGRINFSSDGQWVQYTADDGGRLESWLVPLDGGVPGSPVRVSGTAVADGNDIIAHAFAPDTSAIVYVADSDGPIDLFWVDLSSGAPGSIERVIDPTPIGAGLTGDLRFSPDSAHLLFTGFVTSMETRDVYRVDLSAGPPWTTLQVNPPLRPNEEVGFTPSFAGGSSHVLYVAPGPQRGGRQLFDAPPGGEGFDTVVPISGEGFIKSFRALP